MVRYPTLLDTLSPERFSAYIPNVSLIASLTKRDAIFSCIPKSYLCCPQAQLILLQHLQIFLPVLHLVFLLSAMLLPAMPLEDMRQQTLERFLRSHTPVLSIFIAIATEGTGKSIESRLHNFLQLISHSLLEGMLIDTISSL